MKILDRRGALGGFATLVLFTSLTPDAWRNSISWYGYGVVVVALATVSTVLLVHHRRDIPFASLPWPLLLFLTLCAVSISWSQWRVASALALITQLVTTVIALGITLVLTGPELLRALGRALRVVLVLSFLFELVVAVVIRHPVLPVWAVGTRNPPAILFWSRDLLFSGGAIQGITGSAPLLGMIALIAVIVFGVQVAAGTSSRLEGGFFVVLGLLAIALTRSATIFLAAAGTVIMLAMILVLRRAATPRARRLRYLAIAGGLAVIAATALALQGPLLRVLGKSDTFTGRAGIWDDVIGLAQQHPVFGWGWISFWAPWVEPLGHLIRRGGVQQLQAHNAWLDVWMQLGIVGLVVFGALVVTAGIRSFLLATDRLVTADPSVTAPRFTAGSLVAPLILTALVVQSFAESRLLIEGGWVLLVIIATTTKRGMLGRVAPVDPIRPRISA